MSVELGEHLFQDAVDNGIISTTVVVMLNKKTAIAVAKAIKKITEKIQSSDQLIAVVNHWAEEKIGPDAVFCRGVGSPVVPEFRLADSGFDFSWSPFPGYKTVWVEHKSGVSAKFAINPNITKPLAYGTCDRWEWDYLLDTVD